MILTACVHDLQYALQMQAYGSHHKPATFVELLKGVSKMNDITCAASDRISCWEAIDLRKAETCVKKLQKCISKAWTDDEFDKAVSLQHKMIHSFYAKALSVYIVTSNKGKKSPGVDGVVGKDMSPEEKWNILMSMKRRGYSSMPLRRRYVPKPNGKLRPLSIPTIRDRAMQTLHKLALEPIAETTADPHSYGFRPGRSTKHAIRRCIKVLSAPAGPEWILEGDIQGCFDNISHDWIMEHIPMDKKTLAEFLQCGYVDEGRLYPTSAGVPQGGSISTVICNMVLDGMEPMLMKEFGHEVQFVRYADDFIITGADPYLLRHRVMPLVESFMAERGLHLSPEKTLITHIENGFDFLGWNVRKQGRNILITPSQKNLDAFIGKVRDRVENNKGKSADELWKVLKHLIASWINYHKDIVMPYALYDVEFDIVSYLWQTTRNRQLTSFVGDLFQTD